MRGNTLCYNTGIKGIINSIATSQYETNVQILRLIYKTLNNNEIQYLLAFH